ncbi:LytR/AlgR family response regulator transcription factor [Carboxylicivirga sp. N1Y90]|uniref:LytR/AlgR family response regulator transcription factor n=1 Tax=Carboxylicivirga fragile TaxID=3417571 RepID=UPI003D336B54|nr:response regulator transcription factor [Marinilabiliaceae bacterium N1Y90]
MSKSEQISAIVIDDEKNNRDHLNNLLSKYCGNINVLGMACNATDGLNLIDQTKPQLVFLDIQMPAGSGFDLLSSIKERNFEVIFVTAYDQFAIKAIRFCAFDYLLKPINTLELQHACNRVIDKIRKNRLDTEEQIETFKINKQNQHKRIALPSAERLLFVDTSDIIRCKSESNYTQVYLRSGQKQLVSRTLKEFEDLLADEGFIRVHQSHLVNISEIQSYEKTEGGYLVMKDGTQISLSRMRRESVLEALRS